MSAKSRPNTRDRRRPELISLQGFGGCCDVDERTVRRWIAEGRINAFRVGARLIKIDVAELDKVMRPVGGNA